MDFQIVDRVLVKYEGTSSFVTVPETVTEIGDDAFQEQKNIETVTLPIGLIKIGKWAFSRCAMLQKIMIPQGVKEIGLSAFRSCIRLSAVAIPDSMEVIMGKAFEFCKNLKEVKIPGKVRVIREKTFSNCVGLEKAVLMEGIREIGAWAFENCEGLTFIRIPDSVEVIKENAFLDCDKLAKIEFGKNIKKIGYHAFGETAWLENHSEEYVRVGEILVTYLGRGRNITIPAAIKRIGCGSFEYCRSAERIILHEGIERIGEKAFYCCGNLTEITIPADVLEISADAFRSCDSLSMVRISGYPDKADIRGEKWKLYRQMNLGQNKEIILYIPCEEYKLRFHDFICSSPSGLQVDYEKYDLKFAEIHDNRYKTVMAVLRLLYPLSLSDEMYDTYLKYLQDHAREAGEFMIKTGKLLYLRVMGILALLLGDDIDSLIESSVEDEQAEITCYLLSYKNDTIGYQSQEWIL